MLATTLAHSLNSEETFRNALADIEWHLAISKYSSLYLLFLEKSLNTLGEEVSKQDTLSHRTIADITRIYREVALQQEQSLLHCAYSIFCAVARFFGYAPTPTKNYARTLLQNAYQKAVPHPEQDPLFFLFKKHHLSPLVTLDVFALKELEENREKALRDLVLRNKHQLSSLSVCTQNKVLYQLMDVVKRAPIQRVAPLLNSHFLKRHENEIQHLCVTKEISQADVPFVFSYSEKILEGCQEQEIADFFVALKLIEKKQFLQVLENTSHCIDQNDSFSIKLSYLKIWTIPVSWDELQSIFRSLQEGNDALEGLDLQIERGLSSLSKEQQQTFSAILKAIPIEDPSWSWRRIKKQWDFVVTFCDITPCTTFDFSLFAKGLILVKELQGDSKKKFLKNMRFSSSTLVLSSIQRIYDATHANASLKSRLGNQWDFVFLFCKKMHLLPLSDPVFKRGLTTVESLKNKEKTIFLENLKQLKKPFYKMLNEASLPAEPPDTNKLLARLKSEAPHSPSFSYADIKGIGNARSNNCWLISLLQMMIHAPNLKRVLKDLHEPALTRFIEAYTAYNIVETFQTKKSSINPQVVSSIREYLHKQNHKISDKDTTQEDAGVGLRALLQNAKKEDPIFHKMQSKDKSSVLQKDAALLISLSFTEKQQDRLKDENISFFEKATLFRESLENFFIETEGHATQIHKEFIATPDELIIETKRFYQKEGQDYKMTSTLFVPSTFYLPKKLTSSKEDADYECDIFIEHRGTGINKGHYVTYLKQKNNYYICDDTNVRLISKEIFQSSMSRGYIYHFTKRLAV